MILEGDRPTFVQQLVLLAVAGGLGALARYGLAGAASRVYGTGFPWGTFIVNAIGCFLFGVIWSLAEERLLLDAGSRAVILTGFMGAFTTFSTFIFETGELIRADQWLLAIGNLGGQMVVGLVFLFIGIGVGRLF